MKQSLCAHVKSLGRCCQCHRAHGKPWHGPELGQPYTPHTPSSPRLCNSELFTPFKTNHSSWRCQCLCSVPQLTHWVSTCSSFPLSWLSWVDLSPHLHCWKDMNVWGIYAYVYLDTLIQCTHKTWPQEPRTPCMRYAPHTYMLSSHSLARAGSAFGSCTFKPSWKTPWRWFSCSHSE